MFGIPRSAFSLGVAGLIPFVAAALIVVMDEPVVTEGSYALFYPSDGVKIALSYGVIILSFMSGCLWAFALNAKAPAFYLALSVIPALYCFFYVTGKDSEQLMALAFGFLGLLILDYVMVRAQLAPSWWMRLRILLTAVVVVCLLVVRFV